jgi:hypothetical protein
MIRLESDAFKLMQEGLVFRIQEVRQIHHCQWSIQAKGELVVMNEVCTLELDKRWMLDE